MGVRADRRRARSSNGSRRGGRPSTSAGCSTPRSRRRSRRCRSSGACCATRSCTVPRPLGRFAAAERERGRRRGVRAAARDARRRSARSSGAPRALVRRGRASLARRGRALRPTSHPATNPSSGDHGDHDPDGRRSGPRTGSRCGVLGVLEREDDEHDDRDARDDQLRARTFPTGCTQPPPSPRVAHRPFPLASAPRPPDVTRCILHHRRPWGCCGGCGRARWRPGRARSGSAAMHDDGRAAPSTASCSSMVNRGHGPSRRPCLRRASPSSGRSTRRARPRPRWPRRAVGASRDARGRGRDGHLAPAAGRQARRRPAAARATPTRRAPGS